MLISLAQAKTVTVAHTKTFSDRSNVRMTFQIRFVEGYADTNGSWLSYGALSNSANGESESVIIQNVGGKLYSGPKR